ncbi:hypothetical protein JCM10450v2_006350 [Rhodotorula kratochvilovae]
MPPATLPDELILTIIEMWNWLEKGRQKTLAALCLLAKRYRDGAERALYSRVELRADSWADLMLGSPLGTLLCKPSLRPYVSSVELDIADEFVQDAPVVSLLQGMPNVRAISLHGSSTRASDMLLSQDNLLIGSLKCYASADQAGALLQQYSAVFSMLDCLEFATVPSLPPGTVVSCTAVTSLSIALPCGAAAFVTFTSPFASNFTSLRIPISPRSENHNLASFRNLEYLALACHKFSVVNFKRASSLVTSILATTTSFPSFVSLAVEGNLYVDVDGTPGPFGQGRTRFLASPLQVPPSSKEILDAIPSQVQHLSLVTNFLLAGNVATFLLGPSRPRGLRTLRLGGAVGQGFKEFARSRSAWYADFERTMEEAGVELTTVG